MPQLCYPEAPGTVPQRFSARESYAPVQWERWLSMDDAVWATVGGYAATRHPSPSSRFDGMQERYNAWEQKYSEGWDYESRRLHGSIGMPTEAMPENLRMYLFERLLATRQDTPQGVVARHGWMP